MRPAFLWNDLQHRYASIQEDADALKLADQAAGVRGLAAGLLLQLVGELGELDTNLSRKVQDRSCLPVLLNVFDNLGGLACFDERGGHLDVLAMRGDDALVVAPNVGRAYSWLPLILAH